MEIRHILLIFIVILVIILGCLSAYILTENTSNINQNITQNTTQNSTTKVVSNTSTNGFKSEIRANKTIKTNTTNKTGYRVYNPQSDSYVSVVGEGYDHEFNRWYTFDSDGVRYYNTRIN